MADNKKYYYLKLKDDFFDTDQMIILESMPDGYKYANILLKLYLRSLKHEGKLMFNDRIPYNSTVLAQVTRHSVGDIEKAIQTFRDLDLIEVLDNGAIYITDIQNFIGKSSTEADRKREYRERIEKEKHLQSGQMSGQMSDESPDNSPPEIEIELEKELDIEKETDKEASLSYNQEVYDILSDRGVDMSKSQACFNISRKMSGIDNIQYLNKAIDVAEKKGVMKAPYVLTIIENWFEDGKTTYQHLVEQDKKTVQQYKPKYGTPKALTPEQEAQYNNLGF